MKKQDIKFLCSVLDAQGWNPKIIKEDTRIRFKYARDFFFEIFESNGHYSMKLVRSSFTDANGIKGYVKYAPISLLSVEVTDEIALEEEGMTISAVELFKEILHVFRDYDSNGEPRNVKAICWNKSIPKHVYKIGSNVNLLNMFEVEFVKGFLKEMKSDTEVKGVLKEEKQVMRFKPSSLKMNDLIALAESKKK